MLVLSVPTDDLMSSQQIFRLETVFVNWLQASTSLSATIVFISSPSLPPSLCSLPYRIVYAVASLNAVLFYDTQHLAPFAYVSDIHYASITDIAWYTVVVNLPTYQD